MAVFAGWLGNIAIIIDSAPRKGDIEPCLDF